MHNIQSPIIVDVNGDGYSLTSVGTGVRFDISGTGSTVPVAWTAADSDDAVLVWDRDNSGGIEGGAELFGNASPLPLGGTARSGFEALAALDDNGDGLIDERDAIYSQLQLWTDGDHDGVTSPGELVSPGEVGMVFVETAARESQRQDPSGNLFLQRSLSLWNVGSTVRRRYVYDVWLKVGSVAAP